MEAAPSVRLFAPGTPIGKRYEVREVLGTGGSAVVYAVFDRELSRNVALKVLRPDRMTEGMLRRFRHEVAVAREAESPRLVKVYDIGTAGETVFLTMEMVDGESLRERLHRGPLDVNEAVRIGLEVLEGLRALHALGLVHRDVKPGNVLLADTGGVKLADFGLVRRWEVDETRATATDAVVGTFEYLSPEQALGGDLDGRSDLYSFGVLLFEMLTGDVPHRGLSSVGTAVAHLREKTPDPRVRRPEVPPWLAAVVTRLLEKERADRYASAADVIADLAAHRPPARRPRLGRIRQWILPAVAALLIGAVFLPFWPWNRPRFARLLMAPKQPTVGLDAAGNVLWRRSDLTIPSRAAAGRFRLGGSLDVAAILDVDGSDNPARLPNLSFLDGASGRVLSQTKLLSPAGLFPGFSDMFAAGISGVVDLNGEGMDQVVVTILHRVWWPSITVIVDPRHGTAETVFVASGHHSFVAAVDLDGDGRKEIVVAGPSNRMGWNIGIAAVRVRQASSVGGVSAVWQPAGTPDRSEPGNTENLLWYALVPHPGSSNPDSFIRFDSERRVFEMRNPSGGVEVLTADGFLRSDVSTLTSVERAAARRKSYDRLREATRLLDVAFAEDAVAMGAQALSEAQRAGDRTLSDWTGRFRARALVRSGRLVEAERDFDSLLASSRSPSEVAFDAGRAFHLRGLLPRAVAWYRRSVGRGGAIEQGRGKWEVLEGIILALGEQGKWSDARTEMDRLSFVYPNLGLSKSCYENWTVWRSGGHFDLPPKPALNAPDLARAFWFELLAARGEKPGTVLPDLDSEITRVMDGKYILLSLKADFLAKSGRAGEALPVARDAWASVNAALATEVAARLYLPIVGERLATLEGKAGRAVDARRIRLEVARFRRGG
jgi:tRNA A-37 threonylcarbamoyl transferase component Bud32